MKISELVEKLEDYRQRWGDLDVEIEDAASRNSEIEGAWVRRTHGTCGAARDWIVVGPK